MNASGRHKWGRWLLLLGIGLALGLTGTWAQAKVYADKSSNLFHAETCPEKERIRPGNLRVFDSEPEAESRGFYPCKICIPPTGPPSLVNKQEKKLSLPVNRNQRYIGDREKKIFHYEWCSLVREIPSKQRKVFTSAKTAHRKGFEPCSECNPPVLFKRDIVDTGTGASPTPVLSPEPAKPAALPVAGAEEAQPEAESEEALPEAEIE